MSSTPPTEAEVRALRNRVYDHEISDASWSAIKSNWLKPSEIAWLREHDFPLTTKGKPQS